MDGIRNGILIMLAVYLVAFSTGCSFQVGVDWNGETAKDNRTFTQKK